MRKLGIALAIGCRRGSRWGRRVGLADDINIGVLLGFTRASGGPGAADCGRRRTGVASRSTSRAGRRTASWLRSATTAPAPTRRRRQCGRPADQHQEGAAPWSAACAAARRSRPPTPSGIPTNTVMISPSSTAPSHHHAGGQGPRLPHRAVRCLSGRGARPSADGQGHQGCRRRLRQQRLRQGPRRHLHRGLQGRRRQGCGCGAARGGQGRLPCRARHAGCVTARRPWSCSPTPRARARPCCARRSRAATSRPSSAPTA